jgi:hypothetical protein
MNKIAVILPLAFSINALATMPEDCGSIQDTRGIASIAEYSCSESGCSVSVKAPVSYGLYELVGFTLLADKAPHPELSALLTHQVHDVYGVVHIIGKPAHLAQYGLGIL